MPPDWHGGSSGRELPEAGQFGRSVALEVLDFALVLLRGGKRRERAEVASLAGLRIDLAGIEAVAPGFELADHAIFGSSSGMEFPGRGFAPRFPGPYIGAFTSANASIAPMRRSAGSSNPTSPM